MAGNASMGCNSTRASALQATQEKRVNTRLTRVNQNHVNMAACVLLSTTTLNVHVDQATQENDARNVTNILLNCL